MDELPPFRPRPFAAFMAINDGRRNGAEPGTRRRSVAQRRMAKVRGCFVSRCEGAGPTRAVSVEELRAKRKQASRKLAWPRQERVVTDC